MVWVNYNYIAIITVVIVIRCKDESVANPCPTITYNINDKHIITIGSRIIAWVPYSRLRFIVYDLPVWLETENLSFGRTSVQPQIVKPNIRYLHEFLFNIII